MKREFLKNNNAEYRVETNTSYASFQHNYNAYKKAIEEKRIAFLLAVLNGKLSEGTDFKDDLGRIIMIIGLPYLNLKDTPINEARF